MVFCHYHANLGGAHLLNAILFLDFDGVLHPSETSPSANYLRSPDPSLFIWLPTLATVLAPFPEVHIVVSSDWRTCHDDDDLRQILGPLGDRRIGITETYSETSRVEEILEAVKDRELERWLALDDHESVRIAALDDSRFVWCSSDAGISDVGVQKRLRKQLALL